MKKIKLAMLFLALGLISCEFNEPATSSKIITGDATEVTNNSVTLHGQVTIDISLYKDLEFGMMISEVRDEMNERTAKKYGADILISTDFKMDFFNLRPNTQYYYCAWMLLNDTQYEFGEIKSFTTTEGPGISFAAFSIDSLGSKVFFSPGNLQYNAAKNEWRFALNQWECIGDDNSKISYKNSNWIDLFGFGTGDDPINNISEENSDYQTFTDWGMNSIGEDMPNTWRTLTYNEWYYLIRIRKNFKELSGIAQVNGVNGLVLLPDYWACPKGIKFKSGFHSEYGETHYSDYQTISANDWIKMESAGAIFLPTAGYRAGTVTDGVNDRGFYWSSTSANTDEGYYACFFSVGAGTGHYSRSTARSVRLVKDVE